MATWREFESGAPEMAATAAMLWPGITALDRGQQQRVAIAHASLSRAAAVFADEPTGNLASRASAEVLGLLRRCVTGFGQTPVMVAHDPVAAAYSRRDSRWPVGWRRVPRRSSRAFARLPGTPARHVEYGSIT